MKFLFLFLLFLSPLAAQQMQIAQINQELQAVSPKTSGSENPSMVTKLAVLAGLSLLPFAIMLLTSYMKIVVVLSLLRNALGVQQTPPNQVLNGIALLITIYVMFPTGLLMYQAAEGVITKNPPANILSDESAAFVI